MKKLLESYKTLIALGTQIVFHQEAHDTLMEYKEPLNVIKFNGHYAHLPFAESLSGSLQNYSLIITCSFLDEYHTEFTPGKHPGLRDRIIKAKKITAPAVERINKWQDLKKYRNHLLAHNFRVKGKSFYAPDFVPPFYNIPHTNSEFALLTRLLVVITTCISNEFPELVKQVDFNEKLIDKMQFNYPSVDVEKEIEEIWKIVGDIKALL